MLRYNYYIPLRHKNPMEKKIMLKKEIFTRKRNKKVTFISFC